MAEIVGSAYVRIRALTKQLNKDIKDAVENSSKNIDGKKAGEDVGHDFTDGFDASTGSSFSEAIHRHLSSIDVTDGFGTQIESSISEAITSGLNNSKTQTESEDSGKDHGVRWGGGFFGTLRRIFATTFLSILLSDRPRRTKEAGNDGDEAGRSFGSRFTQSVGRAFSSVGRVFKSFGKSVFRGAVAGLSGLGKRILSSVGLGPDDGEEQGKGFGSKLIGGIGKGMRTAAGVVFSVVGKLLFNKITAIIGLIISVIPLVVNSIMGLVSQLGAIVTGIVGGLTAITSGLFVGILALGPIIAAFLAKTPMLDLFKEEMSAIGQEMRGIAEAAQQEVLPGILLVAKTFSSKFTPTLTEFSAAVGDAFGDFSEHISDILKAGNTVNRVSIILLNTASAFRKFLNGLRPLIDGMLTVFTALSNLAPQVADDLNAIFSRFSDSVNTSGIDGVTETFQNLYNNFKVVMGGLTDFGFALYNVMAIGSRVSGMGFFERFRQFAEDFRNFTVSDSGVAQIEGIFRRAQPVLSEFAGLLSDVIKLIFNSGTSEGGTNATVKFLQMLREDVLPWIEGTLIPGIQAAFGFLKKIGSGVIEVLSPAFDIKKTSFKHVVDLLEDFKEKNGDKAATQFKDAMSEIANALAKIAKAGGSVTVELLKMLLSILQILIDTGVLVAAAKLLGALANVIVFLSKIPGLTTLIAGLLILSKVLSAITTVIGFLMPALNALAYGIGFLAGVLGISIGWAAALVAAIVILAVVIVKNWKSIVGFFKDLPKNIGKFLTWIKEEMLPAIGRFFGRIPGYITTAFKAVGGAIKAAVPAIMRAILDFASKIPGWVLGALKTLGSLVLTALTAAFNFVKNNGPTILMGIVDFASSIPGKIIGALLSLGSLLFKAFVAAFDFIFQNGLTIIGKVISFMLELPFRIIMALGALGSMLFDWAKSAFQWIVDNGPTILENLINWVRSIPGKIIDGLVGLGKRIYGYLKSAFNWVVDHGPSMISGLIDFFKELPGKIFTAIKDGLTSGGKAAIGIAKDIFNAVVGFINDHLVIPIRDFEVSFFGKKFTPFRFLPILPELAAQGGIYDRATNLIAGEDGKEVLLPLTKPKRALELAMQSGLFDVLNRATMTSPMGAPAGLSPPILARSGNSAPTQVIFEHGAIDARGLDPGTAADFIAQRMAWKLSIAGGSK